MSGTRGDLTLRDVAAFVRSKNAGPFVLTIDIFFGTADDCDRILESGVLSPDRIAHIYGVSSDHIRLIHVPQARAVKISLPRPISAGDIGERDVAGGQQFAPLLNLPVSAGPVRSLGAAQS